MVNLKEVIRFTDNQKDQKEKWGITVNKFLAKKREITIMIQNTIKDLPNIVSDPTSNIQIKYLEAKISVINETANTLMEELRKIESVYDRPGLRGCLRR